MELCKIEVIRLDKSLFTHYIAVSNPKNRRFYYEKIVRRIARSISDLRTLSR